MFVSVGLSGVLPMSHAVRLFGVRQANLQMGWSWFVGEAAFYISGAIIYAVLSPEFCNLYGPMLKMSVDKNTRTMETRTV